MHDGPPNKLSGEASLNANALKEALSMGVDMAKVQKVAVATGAYALMDENGDIHYMPDPSEIGVVGDKGPEGEQGPPGHVPEEAGPAAVPWANYQAEDEESTSPKIQLPEMGGFMNRNKAMNEKVLNVLPSEWLGPHGCEIPEGMLEEAEAKAAGKGITLQDIIGSKKVAATETGGVVLMPQEFDADNVKAYIQQEIDAGIKEHQTALMRKVADVLAEEITKVKNTQKTREDQQEYRIASFDHFLKAHRLEAEEFDKKRALDIAELQLKVEELEARLEEKTKETKMLREKLHVASRKKPVRKIGKVNSVINGAHGTSKAGDGQ